MGIAGESGKLINVNDRTGEVSMPRRRTIKGVLDNFLGTYTSRYSDYDGYWLFGMVVGEVTDYWFARHRWEGPSPQHVADEIVDAMTKLLEHQVVLKRGALAALASCRNRGLALAVASSSPRRLIEVVVDGLGLGPWFSVVRSAQDEEAGKPDPAVYLSAAAALGVDPRCCVAFEDAPAGVRAAHGAGMVCVAVPESGGVVTSADVAGLGLADVIIDSLEDVDDALWARLAR